MSISVVIPAYRAPTLPAVLDALEPQARAAGCEVIVIESSGAGAAERLQEDRPWVRVLAPAERTLPGRARNLAAGVARGEVLAYLDADSIPEPGWLDALAGALVPGVEAVAGAVVNGTPRSPVGTAGYLLEFSEWLPGRVRPLRHAATCNLLLRRSALERRGGFVEDVWPGEDTILTFALAEDAALAFAPGARVRHLNRTGLREFMRHQLRLGAAFADVCNRVPFPHRSLVRPLLAPLTGPFRLAALARRLASRPGRRHSRSRCCRCSSRARSGGPWASRGAPPIFAPGAPHERVAATSPGEPSVRLSIVVIARGPSRMLCRLLAGLAAAEGIEQCDVLVGFNGARLDAGDRLELERAAERVPLQVVEVERTWPGHARNLVAKSARGDILLFLDDDVEVPPTLLAGVMEVFADPGVGVAGGPNLTPPSASSFEHLVGRVLASQVGGGPVRGRYRPDRPAPGTELNLSLCNLAVRRRPSSASSSTRHCAAPRRSSCSLGSESRECGSPSVRSSRSSTGAVRTRTATSARSSSTGSGAARCSCGARLLDRPRSCSRSRFPRPCSASSPRVPAPRSV